MFHAIQCFMYNHFKGSFFPSCYLTSYLAARVFTSASLCKPLPRMWETTSCTTVNINKHQEQSNIYSSITNWNNCQIFQSYYRDEHLFISLEAGINHSAKTLFDLYFITSDYLLSNVSKIKCSHHMSREATLTSHIVLHYQVTLL